MLGIDIEIDVIEGHRAQSFKYVLSWKPLHCIYMQCVEQNSNFHDLFALMKLADLTSETGGFLFTVDHHEYR